MELLSTGEFAQLNHVTKKALMLYQRIGLLLPEKVDEDTGYRFYTLDQCSTLDMILQLQRIGLSLQEIHEIMDAHDLAHTEAKVNAKITLLEAQLRETRLALETASGLRDALHSYRTLSPDPKIRLKEFPSMTLLRFPVEPYRVQRTYDEDPGLHNWERSLRSIKEEMIRRNMPLLHFHNVGCIVSRESLEDGVPVCTGGFIPCPPEYLDLAETVPSGPRLTVTLSRTFNDEGQHMEYLHIMRMLEMIQENGWQITGDYYAEILAETPAFFYEGRDMMLRLHLPVSLA